MGCCNFCDAQYGFHNTSTILDSKYKCQGLKNSTHMGIDGF